MCNINRTNLKLEYGELYATILDLLFAYDPAGVNFGQNWDEYEPEVDTILPRLDEATSEEDALTIIHQEFQRWFGADGAGPLSAYEEVAHEIWSEFVQYQRY